MPFIFNVYSALLLPYFVQGLVVSVVLLTRSRRQGTPADGWLALLLLLSTARVAQWMLGFVPRERRAASFGPSSQLHVPAMKSLLTTTFAFLMLGNRPVQPTATPALITVADLQPLLRSDWQGTLTYRDYQNQRLVTLATQLSAVATSAQDLTLNYVYREPNGATVKGADRLRLQADSAQIEWDGLLMHVQQKQQLPQQTLRLVLLGEGQDNSRPATIRRTVLLAARHYSVRKEVRFQHDTAFLMRNEYRFQR